MTLLKCSSCEISLAYRSGPSEKVAGFYWLQNDDYMSRICLCVDCVQSPNMKKVKSIAPKERGLELVFDCDINGFIMRMNGENCFDCGDVFGPGDEFYRDGWRLYHPKCRGIFDGLFKSENNIKERRASKKDELRAEGKTSLSRAQREKS